MKKTSMKFSRDELSVIKFIRTDIPRTEAVKKEMAKAKDLGGGR